MSRKRVYEASLDPFLELGLLDLNINKKKIEYYSFFFRILQNALANLLGQDYSNSADMLQCYREAKYWILEDNGKDPFSFISIWTMIFPEISIEDAREAIRKKCEQIEEYIVNEGKEKIKKRKEILKKRSKKCQG